ncbi:hypothetical protein Tco_1398118 [Tanacetum coccineum]
MAKIARRDQRIQAREEDIKKLDKEVKSLRVVGAKAAEAKNADLASELEILREEKIKAAIEFRKLEDEKVERRCAEMDARLDALSIDFDEELQGFADVVSAGIAKGISEGLKHGVEHGKAQLDLELEQLKDAPIDLIMASLHLESDIGEDAPLFMCDLRPSSSQLKIHVYSEVRDPKDPFAVKEAMLLEDVIAANVSRAEKKKKCRIVCRTHGVGSAHHARPDGVLVSVPIVAPQGL